VTGTEPIGGKTYGFFSAEYTVDIVSPIRFAVFYENDLEAMPGNTMTISGSGNVKFGDFNLRLEYKLKEGGNSGVFARIPHNGAIQNGIATQEQGDAYDAHVADHGDFSGCAVPQDVQQGHNGGGREVDVIRSAPRRIQGLTDW